MVANRRMWVSSASRLLHRQLNKLLRRTALHLQERMLHVLSLLTLLQAQRPDPTHGNNAGSAVGVAKRASQVKTHFGVSAA